MLLHTIFYLMVTLIDTIAEVITSTTGLEMDSSSITSFISLCRYYIVTSIQYTQYFFTEHTWNYIITALGTFFFVYPTYKITVLLIKKFLPSD